jgi:hypothetical protein
MGLNSVNPSGILLTLNLASSLLKLGWLDAVYLQLDQETRSASLSEANIHLSYRRMAIIFLLRGFAYVHGIMHGERVGSREQVFRIH